MSMSWEKLEYIVPMPAAPISTAPPSRCPTAPSISSRGAKVVTPVTVCGHAIRRMAHASWRTEAADQRRAGGGAAAGVCAAAAFVCAAARTAAALYAAPHARFFLFFAAFGAGISEQAALLGVTALAGACAAVSPTALNVFFFAVTVGLLEWADRIGCFSEGFPQSFTASLFRPCRSRP